MAAATAVAALLTIGLPAIPSGAAITPCTTPPAVYPQSKLTAGTLGTGWTTVQGRTPVSFNVQVLGTETDGIAPGIDLILVQVSGSVIDKTGGIAYGFSGSPVYVNGKLAGAIAYTFYYGDHTIGGMTPAQPMVNLLSYPGPATAIPKAVHVSTALRRETAAATGVKTADVSATMHAIPMSFAASGLSDTNMTDLQNVLDRHGFAASAYTAGSAPAPTSQTLSNTPLQPGQPFAVALSYGTITFAAVGMVTLVCGDYAIAFGHEFNLKGGNVADGENAADIITVVSDPSGLVGGFDLATVGEPVGTVDQDRLEGVRGVQGKLVHAMPITSDVKNLDIGTELVRESDVVAKGYWPRYVTLYHVYENLLASLDSRTGTTTMNWTINGKSGGQKFTIVRDDEFSGGGFYYRGAYEIYSEMRSLQYNQFGHADIRGIHLDATVTAAKDLASIRRPHTASSVDPVLSKRRKIDVKAGDTVKVMVPVRPLDGSPLVRVPLSIPVPSSVKGDGKLEVRNGYPPYYTSGKTLDEVIKRIQNAEHAYDLVVTLKMKGFSKTLHYQLPQDYVLQRNRFTVKANYVP